MSDANDIQPDNQQVNQNDSQGGDNTTDQAPQADAQAPAGNGDDSQKKTVPLASLLETKNQLKEAKQKLEAIALEQKQADEAKMKEDGQTAELLAQKEKELAEKTSAFDSLNERYSAIEESFNKTIEEQLSSVKDKDTRELITQSLDGKPAQDKLSLLGGLLSKFGQPKNINHTPSQGADNNGTKTRSEMIAEAKESGDVMDLIKNAPTREKNPPLVR